MVAQIFLDLILHARLPLSLVNLIIMDECHHASGSHPMREIMRQYESLKKSFPQKCPRVLGLTACVIHRKCKKKDVMDTMKKLESAMDCVLVTTTDQEVTKYSASPKEKIICYKSDTFSEYQEIISAQLQGIIEDVKDDPDIEDKYKKVFIKKMRNISHIMETLGDWCVARAIMYEMEYFDDVERIEDVPALRQLMASLRGRLQEILDYCGREEATMSPIENVSNKVKRLYDIFHACNKVVYGLIFVERRNTAKILYDLLSAAANESDNLAFVKPLYAVGSMSRCSTDIHLAQLELCRQKETLNKFRNGDCNFLVSTSVLEEGVDIRKCNIVIRFDKPQNYRAYLQSRGRARAHPSRYLLMVKVAELQEMLETLEVYREIEASFTQLCHNRQLPTRIESSLHFAEDEYIAPYQPYGINGPKITGNSAIALINLYCGNLPQDKFTVLAPEVVYEKSDQGCVAEIKLPINACLKTKVRGDCMENKELAKKSAALNLCKKLHAMGELNHDLRPAEISDDSILEGLVEVVPEMPIKAGEPEPGTRKRRQLYEREVCQAFTYYHGLFKLYSIIIQPTGTQHTSLLVDSTKSDMSVGLICKRSLLHCPFALYYTKWGEVEVRVKFIKEIMNLNPELMRKIEHFHKFIFETLLDINSVLFDFSSRNTGVYIVPLAQASTIDLTLLTQIYMLPHLRVPIVYRSAESFHFEKSSYEDAIIYPLYTTEEPVHMFYVTEILTNLSPQSEFPDSKHVYSSYCHYYLQKYGKSITNMQQPLISAKHLPKELNYLKMPAMSAMSCKSSNKAKHHPPIFVPELCGVLPLKASLWWQIMCIPSIIHRLNSLNLAHQLNVAMNDSKLISKDVEYEKINFNWPEEIITRINNSGEENLCASLMKSKSEYIHPFVIVHALTLCAAHENFDLERLEILGDSFLKFIITEYLFLKETESHEGRLSLRRGKLVCNRTLSSLAKCKSIPNKMQSFYLEPPLNGLLLGFTIKPEVSNKLRSCNLSHDKWPSLPKSSRLENLQEVVKNIGGEREKTSRARKRAANCYNPWSEHDLSDKNIADSTEALIGAYLLAAGADTAVNFMHNLGLGVYNVVKNIGGEREKASRGKKRAASCYNPWSEHDLSDKNIADSTEALIGAYLLAAGADTAVNFMHNLGLGVYNVSTVHHVC
nr:endoribonuclease Dicer-like [Cherax quadricarinatus]